MKKIFTVWILIFVDLVLIACNPSDNPDGENSDVDLRALHPKNDIYYQLFIRSFADSDGEGVGDFNGITENLDYIKDLGATAIWMLPWNETDTEWNSYHGYRVKD